MLTHTNRRHSGKEHRRLFVGIKPVIVQKPNKFGFNSERYFQTIPTPSTKRTRCFQPEEVVGSTVEVDALHHLGKEILAIW